LQKPKSIKLFKKLFIVALILATTATAQSQTAKKSWYESFQIRGYSQIRYNRLLETNEKYKSDQGDKSIGDKGGFFIRRMRIIFQGNIGEHVFLYVQPDFASSLSSSINNIHFAQLRDAYFDVGLDKHNEFRFRIGQSKVPFGFENLQSSQNRLALDRNDALNSAVSNERDLGIHFMYAPAKIRKLFASLVADGLKGSGDYGIASFGVFNGQVANKNEANNSPHMVARLTYPLEIGSQIVEGSVMGYKGKYVVNDLTAGVKYLKDQNYRDERVGGTFVLYPKPFGICAEYNVGVGPEFNKLTDSIENKRLRGGYATFTYKTNIGKHVLLPFYRTQYYSGGKKFEADATSHTMTENEIGVEWQPNKNFELVTMYTMGSRRAENFKNKNNQQVGNLLRLQAQVNF
jgi:hypothetical protein